MTDESSFSCTNAACINLSARLTSCRSFRPLQKQVMATPVDLLSTRMSSVGISGRAAKTTISKNTQRTHTHPSTTDALGRPFVEAGSVRAPLDDTSVPVVYLHTLCPYAQRVWIAFLEKGADFQPVQIDLSDKPAYYRSICRLVPAVSYQGQVITESIDICRWVDSNLEGPDLSPSNKRQLPEMDSLVSSAAKLISAGLDLLAGKTGRSWGIGVGQSSMQRKAFEQQLGTLSRALQNSGGPYLLGQQLTLADIVIFPFIERFSLAMPEYAGYDVSSAMDGTIGTWLSAMARRPSCMTASADAALFSAAIREHRSLDFFDFTTYAVETLHPHVAQANAHKPTI